MPGYSRRFIWLFGAIGLAIALYTGGWYYVAGLVDGEASRVIASANRDGVRFNCENSQVAGYPFRLGLNCDGVVYEHAVQGLALTTGAFRSTAQVYNPSFLVGELDGEARLEVPGLAPLTADWEVLRSSVRLASPLPTRVSAEARRLSIAADIAGAGSQRLLNAQRFEAHMRPNGDALDLATSLQDLEFDPVAVDGRQLPPIDGGIDLKLHEGVRWLASQQRSLRGLSGEVTEFYLSPGSDIVVRSSGTFSVDMQGLVDARFFVTTRNPDALAEIVSAAFPESASEITNFAASYKALGEGAELPLNVDKGMISYGFIELGEIPPLP